MRSKLPWVWTGFVFIVSMAVLLIGGASSGGFGSLEAAVSWMVLPVLFTGLGALIVSRQPGNRIAGILFVVGVGILLDGLAQPFVGETAPASPSVIDYVALFLANSMWVVIFFPLFLLLYLFPTGSFLTRRWSWGGWLAGVMAVIFFGLGMLFEGWGPPSDDYDWLIDNPIGFIPLSLWEGPFGAIWMLGLLALSLGGFAAMTVRFRRSGLVERTQIKWVLYAGLVFALTYVASLVANWYGRSFGYGILGFLFVISIGLIPMSITAAITRYRLFEIDRIISRTLSYAAVVIVLGALFVGMVTVVTALLPTQNSLAVAGATLAVAALFNPIRRRIQHAVDRRFNRSGYRAELVSEEFAAKLREPLSSQEIMGLWSQTVEDAMEPQAAGIWLKDT